MNPALLDSWSSTEAKDGASVSSPRNQTQALEKVRPIASLYPGHRVLAIFPFFNEGPKIKSMAARLRRGLVDCFLGVDNGSSDDGPSTLSQQNIAVLRQPEGGVGSCIRAAIDHGRRHGFDILVVMAGNDKDDPEQIPRLLAPILENGADYVQGSRFLRGGSSVRLPLFRHIS